MAEAIDYKTDLDNAMKFVLNPQFYTHIALLNALTVDMEGMKTNKNPIEVLQLFILSVSKLQAVLIASKKILKDDIKNPESEFNQELKAYFQEIEAEKDERKKIIYEAKMATKKLELLMEKAFEGQMSEPDLHM